MSKRYFVSENAKENRSIKATRLPNKFKSQQNNISFSLVSYLCNRKSFSQKRTPDDKCKNPNNCQIQQKASWTKIINMISCLIHRPCVFKNHSHKWPNARTIK